MSIHNNIMIIEFTQNKRFLRVYNSDTLPSKIFYIFITHYSRSILLYDLTV